MARGERAGEKLGDIADCESMSWEMGDLAWLPGGACTCLGGRHVMMGGTLVSTLATPPPPPSSFRAEISWKT